MKFFVKNSISYGTNSTILFKEECKLNGAVEERKVVYSHLSSLLWSNLTPFSLTSIEGTWTNFAVFMLYVAVQLVLMHWIYLKKHYNGLIAMWRWIIYVQMGNNLSRPWKQMSLIFWERRLHSITIWLFWILQHLPNRKKTFQKHAKATKISTNLLWWRCLLIRCYGLALVLLTWTLNYFRKSYNKQQWKQAEKFELFNDIDSLRITPWIRVILRAWITWRVFYYTLHDNKILVHSFGIYFLNLCRKFLQKNQWQRKIQ